MLFYTGIGSRTTPQPICDTMTAIARHYAGLGYTLRRGIVQGGTATAVRCAKEQGIPTFNLLHQLEEFRAYTRGCNA